MIVAVIEEKKPKRKEHPKLCGYRLFEVERKRLRRIARHERDENQRVNESHAIRVAINEKYERMFPVKTHAIND